VFGGVAVEGPRSEGLLQGAPDGHLRERGGGGGRGVRLRLGGGLPGGLLLASEDKVPAQSGRKQLTSQALTNRKKEAKVPLPIGWQQDRIADQSGSGRKKQLTN
jgi:hypothetical protein